MASTSVAVPNPLSALRVVEQLKTCLAASEQGAGETPATMPSELKVKHDLVSLLLHAVMLALDFRLLGVGEDGPSQPSADPKRLPVGWCQGDSYAFRYRHTQSTFTFLIKSVRMAKKLLVHGSSLEDGKIFSAQFDVDEHVTSSAAGRISRKPRQAGPVRATYLVADDIDSSVFIKPEELIRSFKGGIVEKLIPRLQKEGYEDAPVTSSEAGVQTTHGEPGASRGPQWAPPAAGRPGFYPAAPPDDHDPLRIGGPMYPPRFGNPDLDPLAAGGLGPPGFYSPFGRPPSGMIVGPDDPMFGGFGGIPRPGRMGPPVLPPGAVPPGARFDPITPFGPRPRMPGGRGGPTGNFFSGDPDPDELPPPGYGDMFM